MTEKTFDLNEFLRETRSFRKIGESYRFQNVRPRIYCNDGFNLSVQAGESLYSHPRDDDADFYTHVEIGFPSEHDESLLHYGEQSGDISYVYGYVPVEVVESLIEKHMGFSHYGENDLFETESPKEYKSGEIEYDGMKLAWDEIAVSIIDGDMVIATFELPDWRKNYFAITYSGKVNE